MIDAHQHFWQLSQPFEYGWLDNPKLAKIRRDFLPGDLTPLLAKTGVRETVFVQTQHNLDENLWVLSLAERYPFIVGVVGWVDLQSPQCADQVAEFQAHPKFVGVRHITQDEPDDDFIVRPAVWNGLRVLERAGVPFDLLFYVKHLRHAATVARAFPELRLVIDHLAKPEIAAQRVDNWLPALTEAARCPNVFVKLSGLVTEADWSAWQPSDLAPYVRAAVDLFGPSRCMFGSDWPVCELAATYEQVVQALRTALGPLSPTEESQIFRDTAKSFYGL